MAAPKKQPTALKVLKGTLEKSRISKNEPKARVEKPIVPDWLDERGKQYYHEIADVLVGLKILTKGDREALAILANTYGEYRMLDELVKKHGVVYETATQTGATMYRARPEVALRSDASKRLRSYMTDFGLTPSSRASVSSLEEDEHDPMAGILNG